MFGEAVGKESCRLAESRPQASHLAGIERLVVRLINNFT